MTRGFCNYARISVVQWIRQPNDSARREPPPASTVAAAVRLLADTDERVVGTCRRQLLQWGRIAIPEVRQAARHGEPRLRTRARRLLRTLELRVWNRGMLRFVRALQRERGAAARWRDPRVLEGGAMLLASLARIGRVDRAAGQRIGG